MSDYGPPTGDDELDAVGDIVSRCFNMPPDDVPGWLARTGPANLRVLRDRGVVCGSLAILRMGQWFGGRSVPMGGLAAVGVAPERRGAGHALSLTRAALVELAGSGLALSTLYPATTRLYRQAGYEVAGGRYELRLESRHIGLRERTLPLRPAVAGDMPAIAELGRRRAAGGAGQLDRTEELWRRIREPRGRLVRGYVVEREGRVDGYAFVHQATLPGRSGRYELQLADCVAASPEAGRRLLTFLADHASRAEDAILYGGPSDPLLALLPERCWTVRLVDPWMVRVLDVARALAARGWPVAARGALLLQVRDDLLPANDGRFLLEVEGGAARASPAPRTAHRKAGGPPLLSMDVAGLAPLYTGHLTPRELEVAGLLSGAPEALDLAASLFAGPAPVMTDMF